MIAEQVGIAHTSKSRGPPSLGGIGGPRGAARTGEVSRGVMIIPAITMPRSTNLTLAAWISACVRSSCRRPGLRNEQPKYALGLELGSGSPNRTANRSRCQGVHFLPWHRWWNVTVPTVPESDRAVLDNGQHDRNISGVFEYLAVGL